jgi:hypothetical protein
VELSDLATNCTVTEVNPGAVTVVANATVQSSFTVTCVSGSIEIITATTGTDPDGYAASLDGGPQQAIGINGSLTLSDVAAGPHRVLLEGLASNCSVNGANPKTVTVVGNATVQAPFDVTCGNPGNIRVNVTTTGTHIPGLFIAVFPPAFDFMEVSPNGSTTSHALSVGNHTVTLAVPTTCTVTSAASQTVTVQPEATTDVYFTVVCR